MTFHLKKSKNNLNTKMKLYTTSEFISNDISLKKKKKKTHYKYETFQN